MPALTDPVGRVRLIGSVEAVSFLLLLGVAMPLKYLAGMPAAVLVVGWAHGVLFMLYLAAVAHAVVLKRLSFASAALAVVASVVPFGPFVLDARLRREEAVPGPAPEAVADRRTEECVR
jgi:integral membrane protein